MEHAPCAATELSTQALLLSILIALILMMTTVTLSRMSTMPFLTAQAMPMPVSFFLTFSRAISAQSAASSISHNAIGWPSSSLGLGCCVSTKPSLMGLCQAPNRLQSDQSIKKLTSCSSNICLRFCVDPMMLVTCSIQAKHTALAEKLTMKILRYCMGPNLVLIEQISILSSCQTANVHVCPSARQHQ